MNWTLIDENTQPQENVLAINKDRECLYGFLTYDKYKNCWTCSLWEAEITNVIAYIPLKELQKSFNEQ